MSVIKTERRIPLNPRGDTIDLEKLHTPFNSDAVYTGLMGTVVLQDYLAKVAGWFESGAHYMSKKVIYKEIRVIPKSLGIAIADIENDVFPVTLCSSFVFSKSHIVFEEFNRKNIRSESLAYLKYMQSLIPKESKDEDVIVVINMPWYADQNATLIKSNLWEAFL